MSKALKIGTRTLYRLIADLRKQGFVENVGVSKEPQWVLKNGWLVSLSSVKWDLYENKNSVNSKAIHGVYNIK